MADGEVFLFTRTGPPETTLVLCYQVLSLTHFTGGEAHRLPHLNVTWLWEREQREEGLKNVFLFHKLLCTQHVHLMGEICQIINFKQL